MDFNVETMLDKMLEQLRNITNTDTVIGKEFRLGEFTCVPVIKINMGYGSGGGLGDSPKQGKGTGGGIGGGLNIVPIAFLVTRGNEINLLNVGKGKGFEPFLEKLPDMMDKFMERKKNGGETRQEG